MAEGFDTLSRRIVYEGAIIKVAVDELELPDGEVVEREVVVHPGAVGLAAVTGGKIVLIRQYRQPVGGNILEIPAGKLAPGEDPEQCARRELAEETGFRAGKMEKLAEFYTTPGFTDERFHMFLAQDLSHGANDPDKHEEEHLEIVLMPISAALEKIENGEIQDGKTLIAVMLAARRLGFGRRDEGDVV